MTSQKRSGDNLSGIKHWGCAVVACGVCGFETTAFEAAHSSWSVVDVCDGYGSTIVCGFCVWGENEPLPITLTRRMAMSPLSSITNLNSTPQRVGGKNGE